ncbi:hypothetical protein JCM5353_006850 [Sporobolomyces roseus]
MDSTLLYVTLAFALISFLCSTYTTLRTLLPLLPDHPLNPRTNGAPPTTVHDQRPRLKSAQRFTAYLALTDVFATCILISEVACAVSSSSQLGYSRLSDSRVVLATTARPTLLLIVAVLSYVNVVQGRAISLGFADCIVWGPALILYSLGAGLASLATVDGKDVWIGLIVWLSTATAIVTFCFTRLLIAILRVRSMTKREQVFSPWAREQEKAIRISSEHDMPYNRYSLTFHPNYSGLSANFVGTIGRPSQGLPPQQQRDLIPYTSDTRSAVSYGPSRPSYEQDQVEQFDEIPHQRDFRSPTPGSLHGLLDRSTATTPVSNLSQSTKRRPEDDVEEVLEDRGRHSIGESVASRASTYLAAGGFVGGSAVRQAIIREAWRDQDPPGTGHSPKVELSDRETRGAMVRLGGHLASSLLGYALISPLICLRIANSTSSVPLIASVLLVIGVCQPPIVLAYQCWMSEGFWYHRSTRSIKEIEVITTDKTRDRSASRASTIETWKSSVPGIPVDGRDIASNIRGRMGRALSVLSAHPKLQLLNGTSDITEPSSSTSGFVKSAASQGHARLRSLKLSKASYQTMGDMVRSRSRANSTTSRKTVGGFEHSRVLSTPVNDFDRAIAMQLLASRRTPSASEPKGEADLDSRSLKDLADRKRAPSPSPPPSPSPSPPSPVHEFEFSTHEITLSPSSSTFPTTSASQTFPQESTRPISIDYLSAQVLPQLVPSLRLGHLHIDPRSNPIPTPPRSADSLASPSTKFARGSRKLRTRSFPGFPVKGDTDISFEIDDTAGEEAWIAVEEEVKGEEDLEKERVEEEQTDLREESRTTAHHERSGSSMTRLDISFEWEAVDSTEILDDSTSPLESTLPFSPILPLSISRRQSLPDSPRDEDDDVDLHTSTINCATVRPVSRNSDVSTSFESPRLISRPKQEEHHDSMASRDSARSLGDANQSSITSEGFRNLLNSGSWHVQVLPVDDRTTPDNPLSTHAALPRRPLPTTPLRPGHRPLSLLGQRDINLAASAASESDREQQKTSRYAAARNEEESSTLPSTRPNIPLPPIPAPIEEIDEDRKSGTPTPKSRRTLKARRESENRQTPTTSSSTSRTPPNVTSRSKLRSRHQRNASSISINDENIQIQGTKTPKAPRATRPPPLSLRTMR